MPDVCVRIAPSPTGDPHVGTAYIALFNYCFTKRNDGRFILRIEDTDRARSRPEYEGGILEALRWLGLKWDEGPDVGGPHGPYRQSERTELYRQYANVLLENGGAYRCFCTPERLEEMRAQQRRNKMPPKYDGLCKKLTPKEVEDKIAQGVPFVIRLKVPSEGVSVVKDRLRGEVTYNYSQIDDQILLKSDGFPTYHLANVVDDHLMEITHVIRGEEWIPSTPKHLLLYEYFGWSPPEYIHMPLLLNPDGSKMSKRKNPTSIFYYQKAGFLPEALLNFLGLMSYSRPGGEEKFSLDEMVGDFDLDRVSMGGTVFDLKKLSWLNGRYIREDHTPESLHRRMKEWLLNDDYFARMMPFMQSRMDTLGDFMPLCWFLFAREVDYSPDDLTPKKREKGEVLELLQTVLWVFDEDEGWEAGGIERMLHRVAEYWGWPIRDVTGVLFVAITGKPVAPPLYDSMALLGKDMCRVRILGAMSKLGGLSKNKTDALQSRWKKKAEPSEGQEV